MYPSVNQLLGVRVRRTVLGRGLVCAIVALCTGTPAAAEQWGEGRWVPSIAAMVGAQLNGIDAGARSFDDMGGPLRPSVNGEDLDFTPYVGPNFQLMSPTIDALPGSPRLFVNGEIPILFGVERNVARQGAANGFEIPEVAPGVERPVFDEEAIGGQGSRTTATTEKFSFGAGIGLSFAFEWHERQLRIKPSLAWRHWDVEVSGQVFDASCTQLPSGRTECSLNSISGLGQRRLVAIGAEDEVDYDGIGPALELEMDAARLGEFGVSLYLEGRAYHVLGNRQHRFGASTTAPADPPAFPTANSFSAQFDYGVKPWMFHAGIGVRFSWIGSGS